MTTKGRRRSTQGAVPQLAMSQSQGVGSPGAVDHVAEALLSGSQSRGVGGRKRTRRDSAEPTRKSARGQKPRRSEKVLELYQMGFSEEVVDDAIRRFPSNVGLAATWLLESQGGLTATARETAATSSTQDKPPASSPVDAHLAAQPVVHASGAREQPSLSEDGATSTTQFDLFDDLTVAATSCATPHPPAKGPLAAPISPVVVASSTQGATGSRSRSRKRSRTTEGAPSNRSASTSRRTRSMGPKSSESGLRSPPSAPGATEPAFDPVDGVRTGEVASQVQHGGGGMRAAEAHNVSPGEGVLTSPPAGREELAHDPVPSLGGAVEASEAVRMTRTGWFADAQGDVDERRAGPSVLLEQPRVQQEERSTHAPHANCVGAEELPAHAAPPSQVEAPEQSQLRREVQPKGLLGAQAGTGGGLRLVMEPYPQHVEKEQPPAVRQAPPARTAAAVAAPGVCVDFPRSPSCASPTAEHDPPGGFGSDEEKGSGGLVLQANTDGAAEATPLSLQNPGDDDVAFDYFLSQMSQADQTTDEVSEPCTAKAGLTATALSSEKENVDTAGRPVVATPSTAAAKGLQFTDTGARGVRRTSQSGGHDGYVPTSPRATPDGRSAAFHEDRPPANLSSVACSGKSWWSVSGETPSPVDGAGGEPMRSEKRARTCGGTTGVEDALWPYDELQTSGSRAGACGDAARHNSEGTRSSPGGSSYWRKRSSSPTVVHVGNEDRSMPSAEGLRCSAGRDFVQGSITRGEGALRSEDPPYSAAPRSTDSSFSSSISRTREPPVPLASAVQGLIGHGHTAPAAHGRAFGLGRAAAGKSAETKQMHGSDPSVDDIAANAGSTFGSCASNHSAPLRAAHGDAPSVDACDGEIAISSDRCHGPQVQVEQQRAPEGPIGFSTGTGRRVAVSAASMSRVNHLFEPHETGSRTAGLPSSGGPRRVSYKDCAGPVAALHSRASRPQQKATLGLQQTEPSINRAQVVAARADIALSKFEPVQVTLPDQPVTNRVWQGPPALGPEHSLPRAVQRPATKGGTSAGQAADSAVIESNGSARAAAEALRDLQFSSTNGAVSFSTRRGQPVVVSAASLARVRHLFELTADATTSARGRLQQPFNTSTRQSLVERGPVRQHSSSNGQGEEMPTIESALRRQATVPSESSDGTRQPALPTTAPAAGSPLCPVAEPASEHCAAISGAGDLQVSSSTPAYVSVGFCTGSGRRVTVSEGSMARVSHLFEPTERDGPEGGHRSLSAVSTYGQDMARGSSRAYQQQAPSSQLHGPATRYHHTRQAISLPGAAMGESGAAMVDAMSGTITCAASSTSGDHDLHRALSVQSPRGGGASTAADEAPRGSVDASVDTRATSTSPPVLSVDGGSQQLQSAIAGCGVSFSTGSGRRVAVSAASLARVSHLFEQQEEAKPRRGLPAVMPQKSNALISRRPLSAAVGRERHTTDAGHEVLSTPSSSVAVAVGHIASGAAHAEEVGAGMDVAHSGSLAAGHSVDLGSTSASVAPPRDSTAGAPEDAVPGATPSSGNVVVSFSTGRGRAIAVSEGSMARVSHLFEPTERDSSCGPGGGHRSLSAASTYGQDIFRKAPRAPQQQPASSQLHGQVARSHHTRQAISLPGAAMGASCTAMVDDISGTIPCAPSSTAGHHDPHRLPEVQSSRGGGVYAAADGASRGVVDAGVDTCTTSTSPGVSFSTGSGRRVAVSAASLARVSHLFEQQEEAKPRRGLPAVMPQESNALVSRRPLFAAVGRERHTTDAGHEVSSTPSSSVAVAVGHIASGAAHAEEEGAGMDVAHSGSLAAGHSVDLGSTSASVAPPRDSTAGAAEDAVPGATPSSGNAVVSFSTGRGCAIAVSEGSMARVSHLFEPTERDSSCGPGGGHRSLSAASTYGQDMFRKASRAPQQQPASSQLHGQAVEYHTTRRDTSRPGAAMGASCTAMVDEMSGLIHCATSSTAGDYEPHRLSEVESSRGCSVYAAADGASRGVVDAGVDICTTSTSPPVLGDDGGSQQLQSALAGCGVSFSTGSGRRVTVSAASLARVSHLFEPQEEAKPRRGLPAVMPQESSVLVSRRPLSAAVGKQRHTTDAGHEVSTASSSSVAVAVGHIASDAAHAEEEGAGMDVAHPGGLAAGHSVGLGSTSASVTPVDNSTAGAAEDAVPGASAPSGNAVVSFSTGRGRAIAVSEASMARVCHLFDSLQASSRSSTADAADIPFPSFVPRAAASVSGPALAQPAVNQLSDDSSARGAECQMTSCLAQSAGTTTGRRQPAATDWRDSVSPPAALFESGLVSQGTGSTNAAIGPPMIPPSTQQLVDTGGGVSFSTGGGRRVAVSEASMARVRHLFERSDRGVSMAPVGPIALAGPLVIGKPPLAHQQLPDDEGQRYGPDAPDMPRRWQGTVGDARVNEHMSGRSQGAVLGNESAEFQLPPSGGISTAAVTAHPVTSMASVSHLFEPREVHQADGNSPTLATVHSQSAGSNGGNSTVTAPELASASAASSGVLPFEFVIEASPLPFAGFSTGRGRQLTVSEESMAKTRHLFDEHEKPCGTKVQTGRVRPGADQVPEGTTETGDLTPSAPAPVKAQSEGPSWADDAAGASCMSAVDRTIGGNGSVQEPPLAEPSGQTDTVVSSRGNGDEQPPHFFSSDDEDLLQALEAYEAGLAHGRPSDIAAGNADRHICDTTHVESMDVEQQAPERANDAQPPDTLMRELAPSNGPNVQTTPSAAGSTTDAAGRPASKPRDLDLGELLADLTQERLRLWDLGPRPCDELDTIRQYVCPVVIAITSDNAHRLRFDAQGLPARLEDVEASNPAGEHLVLPVDVLGRLVAGVMDGKDGKKPPLEKWFANHYRLIVWKLACLERAFPQRLGGRYLTEARVAAQMRYRYDREVAGGARPAVRLVCNGDAPATRLMILCVSKVYPPLLTTPDGEPIPLPSAQDEADADEVAPLPAAIAINASDEAERPQVAAVVRLELTDGWYCIDAVLDEALSALAARGRIRVGVKLAVCNASLQNASGGIEPLEIKADDPESRPYLRIHYNATRLTRWHARLGFQRSTNLPLPVSGLLAGGGIVSCVHAVVMRRYETKYLERRPRGKDGGMVIRILSQTEEDLAQAEYEAACQTALEKLSDEMLQEYEKRVAQGGGKAMLPDQHRLQWQEQMEEARRKVLDDPLLHRESSPFFRVRICAVRSLGRALHPDWQFHRLEHVRANVAVLSVWNITDALVDALQEGAYVALYSLSAPAPRDKASVSSTLRLNASSSTRVQLLSRPASQPLLRYCRFEPRQITSSIRILRHIFDPGLGPFVCRDFDCVATLVSFYEWEVPKHKRKTGHRDRVPDDEGGNDKAPYVTRFFFLDQSRCILCVERRDYGQPAANTMPAVGGIFLLTDLAFESYDLKTDTVLARMGANSTMRRVSQSDARRSSFSLASSSQGCPAFARGAMQHFCDWFSSADAAPVRAREEARLSSLLRDVSSLKSDKNAESPASAGSARRAQVYDYRERLIGLLRLEETKASIESRTLSLEVNVIGAGARRVVCDTMESLKALAGGLWQGLPEYMRSSLLEANILRELVESEPPQSPQTVATGTNVRTGQEQPQLQQGRPWPGASLAAQMVTWAEGLLCTQTFEVLVQRSQSECSQEDVYEVIELRVLHTLDE